MAEWWEAAPLVQPKKTTEENWWEAAPLVNESKNPTDPSVGRFTKGLIVKPAADMVKTAQNIGTGLVSGQNPIDRIGWGMAASHVRQGKRAVEDFKRGRYVDAAADAVMALIPGVGPMLGDIAERGAKHLEDEDYAALSEDAGEALSAPLLTYLGTRQVPPAVKAAAKGGLRGGIEGLVAQAESLPTVVDLIPGAKQAKSVLGALKGAYEGANAALRPPPLPPQTPAAPPPVPPPVAKSQPQGGVRLRPGQVTPEQAIADAEARSAANRAAAQAKDVVRDLLQNQDQPGRRPPPVAPSPTVPRELPKPPATSGLTMPEAQYRRGLESLTSRRRLPPEAKPQVSEPPPVAQRQAVEPAGPMSRLTPQQYANAEALREWAGDMGPQVDAPPVQYEAAARAKKVWNISDLLHEVGTASDAIGEMTPAHWQQVTQAINELNYREWVAGGRVGKAPNRHAIPGPKAIQQIRQELAEIEARQSPN